MSLMKAVIASAVDGSLQLKEIPKPTPQPRDLLIKVKAVAVNPVEPKMRKGTGTTRVTLRENHVLGFEAAGVVEAVGSEVQYFKVGDEVFYAGVANRNGSNAEYTVVDERTAALKPKSLSFEQAAGLALTGITAWEGIFEQLELDPSKDYSNKSMLVIAGAGGVGSFVIPIAKKLLKLKVIATASRPETIEFVKSIGADYVIDHKEDYLEGLKKIGFEGGADYIYNCGEASQNVDQVIAAVARFGKIVNINGTVKPVILDSLFHKRGTMTWEFMFARPLFGAEMEKQHEILVKLADLVEKGVLPHRLYRTFSLKTGATEAHDFIATGKVIGKIVLTVDL